MFGRAHGAVRAVDGVDLDAGRGRDARLVGESGCGKSTLGRLALRLIEPTAGRVVFDGKDLGRLDVAALRAERRALQIIFQDPYSSLNPRMTVGQTLAEPLHAARPARRPGARSASPSCCASSASRPSTRERYPHEFSGGQRQRIGIARALAVEPKLIVCDEAVSALDVSVQAQVVNLLQDLQRRFGLAYLFIAHDLAVVKHIATRVAVMYLGRIVELGDKRALFAAPRHPYTQALLAAIPRPEPGLRARARAARRRRAEPGRTARRAAASTPAARMRASSARQREPRSKASPATRWPATSGARSRRLTSAAARPHRTAAAAAPRAPAVGLRPTAARAHRGDAASP